MEGNRYSLNGIQSPTGPRSESPYDAASPDYPDIASDKGSIGGDSPQEEDYERVLSPLGDDSSPGSLSNQSAPRSPAYREQDDESDDDYRAASPGALSSAEAASNVSSPNIPGSPEANLDDESRMYDAHSPNVPDSPDAVRTNNKDETNEPQSPNSTGNNVPSSSSSPKQDTTSSKSAKELEDKTDGKSIAEDAEIASDNKEGSSKQRKRIASSGDESDGGSADEDAHKREADIEGSDKEDASPRKNLLDSDDSDDDMDEEQRKKKLGNLIVNIFGEDIDEDADVTRDDDDEGNEKEQDGHQDYNDEEDYRRGKDDPDRPGFEWDFDRMLREKKAEKKRKRKRRDAGIDIINDDDGIIAHLVNAMKNAAKEDRHSNTERKPALKKRKMLHDVKLMLLRMDMLEAMIDGGMMSAVSEWLAPLPDKSLPALEIRTELLKILSGFGNLDQGVLKQSGLGRAVMLLYKHPRETKENKAMAAQIIREWSRPIFQLETDFRSVSREERVQRDLDHLASIKKKRMSSEVGQSELPTPPKPAERAINRARVPRPSTRDYVVRPKSIVEGEFKGERKCNAFARLDKTHREFLERTRRAAAKRAVGVSLEGRNLAL